MGEHGLLQVALERRFHITGFSLNPIRASSSS
jgi:hypothetical protein